MLELLPALAPAQHSLPPLVRTRAGAAFRPSEERWAIREGHRSSSLNFGAITKIVSPSFLLEFQKALIWYAENMSLHHLENMFKRACHMFEYLVSNRACALSEISGVDVINYHAYLPNDRKWYLGALSGFLKQWTALGFRGVSADAIKVLKELRLKGNRKGVAVLTMDPQNGPFTNIELESIQAALNKAYAAGNVSTDDYLLAWLFMLLGQRPAQYALLKVMDVLAPTVKDGSAIYILRMPRIKQQKQVHRTEFKERLITPQIGKLLNLYADEVKRRFEGILEDVILAPLFPETDSSGLQPAGMKFHKTSGRIANTLNNTLKGLDVFSERTGRRVHVTATRFRRTIGTRAAQEGHGELVIAELLDHTDTQNVGVYVQATPEIVERIDRAVAMALAPLAKAFSGVIVTDESEAIRGDDPTSRIVDPRLEKNFRPMGTCGSHGFCGFMAPIACYTCRNFQAWLDGPHEAVLEHLLTERDRLLANTDRRIASINDRTILAVAEVVRFCLAIKAKTNKVING